MSPLLRPPHTRARPVRPCLAALVLALATLASSSVARAAETSSIAGKVGEPEGKGADKPFLIRPFLALDALSLDLTRGDETLSYVPNTQLAVGLRVGYSGFTISASVDIEASEDPRVFGKTEYVALQAGRAFRIAERELFVSAFLQYHQGLYIENTDDILGDAPPILLPEMTVLSLGATATYYLNPEFSYDESFVEFRPRTDSVGSWTLRVSTGLMGFDNQGIPIIPVSRRAFFGAEGTLHESRAWYGGAMGGYSIDVRVLRRWLLAGSLLVGATIASEAHGTALGSEKGTTLGPSALFAVALGYSGDTLHAGIVASADLEGSKAGSVEQQIIRTAVAVFAGVRF